MRTLRDLGPLLAVFVVLLAAPGTRTLAGEAVGDAATLAGSLAELRGSVQEIAEVLRQLVDFRERELLLQEIDIELRRLQPKHDELQSVTRETRDLEMMMSARKAAMRAAIDAGELSGEEELQARDDMSRMEKELAVRLETLRERHSELEAELRLESVDLENLRRRLDKLRR
ncbi:MAG: hypothetical protein OEQ13_10565 [Acidobacteriota bacterium]|nr:hypothetical protein [Acidobacteriota bacterium]